MPLTSCIVPECTTPTKYSIDLCPKHRYRAEVVGVIDWFAKGRPGAVEELERRWTERQNKRSPKPQGDDGGREIKVPFAGGEVTLGKVDPTPGDDGGPMVSEADAAPVDGFARAMIEADAAPSPETASVEGGVQPVDATGAPRVVLLDIPTPGTYWRDICPEDRARMPPGAVLGAPADHPDAGTLTRRSDRFWETRDGAILTDGQVDNYRHLLSYPPAAGTIAERIEKLAQRVTPAPPGYDGALGADHGSSPGVTWLSSPALPEIDVWTLRAPAMKVLHEDSASEEHPVDWRQTALDSLGAAVGLADGYGPMVVAETVLAELDRRASRIQRLEDEHARASALCVGVPAFRVVYDNGEMKEVPLTLTERVRHLADKGAGAWRVLNEVGALFDAVEHDGELGIKGRVSKVIKARAAQDKEIARLRELVERQADELTVLVNAPYALTREELRQRCEDYARGERLVERALAPKREVARG